MKAMISQPMRGFSDVEIAAIKGRAVEVLEEKGYEVINTLFSDEWAKDHNVDDKVESPVKQVPVYYLAKSIEKMALCDAVYFCKGWENARGCKIEHEVAKAYDLAIIYEE